MMTGIIGGISIAKFVEIPISLPPLAEQQRIVAKIDELMAKCDALEAMQQAQATQRTQTHQAAIQQLLTADDTPTAWQFLKTHFETLYQDKAIVKELRKAILQLAIMGELTERNNLVPTVSELLKKVNHERMHLKIHNSIVENSKREQLSYTIPDSWALVPLGEILISGPTNGYSPKAVDYKTKVKSLTLSATTSGVFKGEHSKFIDENIPIDSGLWLQDGDILVQRGNTIEYVGVPAIYRGEGNLFIYPDLMMKLRVSTELDYEYIYYVMSAAPSRNFLRKRASGTSGTMPKINQKILCSLPIPLPPLEEQQRIVAKIDQLMALCDQLEARIDERTGKQSELLASVMSEV
jgi:type I restriction enzyme S subunit